MAASSQAYLDVERLLMAGWRGLSVIGAPRVASRTPFGE